MKEIKLKNGKKKIEQKIWNMNIYIYIYGCQQFEAIRSFGDNIYTSKN